MPIPASLICIKTELPLSLTLISTFALFGEYFIIFTGSGANGKSQLFKMVAKIFGEFFKSFDNTLLNENVSFRSSLTTRALAWLIISNFVLLVMTLGLATPWAKVRRAQLILKNTLVDVESGFDGFITQQQEQQSALGEQVGDAFDIDIAMGV